MKTSYKYIEFEPTLGHDDEWKCVNKKAKTILGYVSFYEPWKQYVIEFLEDCVFNVSCLNNIAHFLRQLNQATESRPPKGAEPSGD